jgi:nitrogen-specific signal transduction histidine kinase/HD-like signal output (HDOD) protein
MATRTSTIYQIVDHTDLPTLPHVLAKLIETMDAGDATPAKLTSIIKLDPALSHKCISMAYQACEHSHQIIDDIEQAFEIIGFGAIKAMISHVVTQQAFAKNLGISQDVLKNLWQHAITCAHASELIAKEIAYSSPNSAFLAGLLHDIGKLALLVQYPKKYQSIRDLDHSSNEHSLARESALGIDHASAGSQLLRTWSRHTFIADAVLYHHRSLKEIKHAFPLVQIVFTANLMAATQAEVRDRGVAAAQELFGFAPHQTAEIQVQIKVKLQDSEQFLWLGGPDQDEQPSTTSRLNGVQNSIQQAVKHNALLGNVIQNVMAAQDTEALIRELQQATWIMFDVRDMLLFLLDEQGQSLVEQADAYPSMEPIRIPMTLKDCLPVACLLQNEIADSFTRTSYSELTILDAQLIGKLGKQGILCVPLIVNKRQVGCILLGIDKVDFPYLSKQFKLLESIVLQLAVALSTHQKQVKVDDTNLNEQLAAMQARSRKIVHEANNPLGIIKNYLKVLEMKMSGQNMAIDEIRIINEEITRVGEILKGLTAVETQQASQIERVDLNETLADIARLLGATLKSRGEIEIHLNLDDDLPEARVSKNSIKQIAINLLKNAAEAMPDGGQIHVLTSYLPAATGGDQQVANSNGRARIRIRDNGPGLPEDVHSNLYKPQITSKPDHEGLGLSVVKNLIHSLNGSITCDSSLKGTTFTMELPI